MNINKKAKRKGKRKKTLKQLKERQKDKETLLAIWARSAFYGGNPI